MYIDHDISVFITFVTIHVDLLCYIFNQIFCNIQSH